jgi:hypothetical protein
LFRVLSVSWIGVEMFMEKQKMPAVVTSRRMPPR